MRFKKVVLSLIIGSLLVPAQVMSQATIVEVVRARKKNDLFNLKGRVFNASRAGIGSLEGIEQIKGIARAWFIGLSGNNLELLEADTFNHPQFKNLTALDLSDNKITTIKPGACNGLESVRFLWLSGNKLLSIPDGALSGLSKVQLVFVGNNPGGKQLLAQVQKQLPQAHVYTTSMKREALKAAAIAAGIAAAVVAVVLAGRYVYQKPVTAEQQRESEGPVYGPITRKKAEQPAKQAERAKKKIPITREEAVRQEEAQAKALLGQRELFKRAEQQSKGIYVSPETARAIVIQELLGAEGITGEEEVGSITEEFLSNPDFSVEAQFLVATQGQTFTGALKDSLIGQAKDVYDRLRVLNVQGSIPSDLLSNRWAVEALIFGHSENERAQVAQNLLFAEAQNNPNLSTSLVNLLQQHGAKVNAANLNGYTALMKAAWRGHAAAINALVKAPGIDVNAVNANGETALMKAAWSGHAAAIKALVAEGANVNAANADGETALMDAAWSGHAAAIKALVAAGANVNAANANGETALMEAALSGNVAAINALVAAGANVNAVSANGRTALGMARERGYTTIVELLEQAQK